MINLQGKVIKLAAALERRGMDVILVIKGSTTDYTGGGLGKASIGIDKVVGVGTSESVKNKLIATANRMTEGSNSGIEFVFSESEHSKNEAAFMGPRKKVKTLNTKQEKQQNGNAGAGGVSGGGDVVL